MSQRPSGFDICVPGITAGLILVAAVLAMGNAVFPDPIQQVFPHQTLVALSVAIGAASALGLVSLFLHSRGDGGKSRQHVPSDDLKNKNDFPLGGTDAL